MPMTVKEATSKDDFYQLPQHEQRNILARIEPDFAQLPEAEQNKAIGKFHQQYYQSPEFAQAHPGSDPNAKQDGGPGFWSWGTAWDAASTLAHDALPVVGGVVKGTADLLGEVLDPWRPKTNIMAGALAQTEQAEQARDLWKQGRKSEAFGHGLAAVAPAGPQAAEVAQEWADKKYGQALAHTGELVVPLLVHNMPESVNIAGRRVPTNLPKTKIRAGVNKGIEKLGQGKDYLFKKDTEVAATNWLHPTTREEDFGEGLHDTLAHIKETHGGEIKTNKEAIAATEKALDEHDKVFNQWMNRARKRGAVINGDRIVNATEQAIPRVLRDQHPEVADAIIERTRRAWGGRLLTVDEAEQIRTELTGQLKPFFEKATTDQIAVSSGGSPQSVLVAQREAFADSLYRALDPENEGAGPRSVYKRKSQMLNVLQDARKRQHTATGSKPVSRAAAIGGVAPRAVGSLFKGGTGILKTADLTNPETLYAGSVDPWVRKTFQSVGKPTTKLARPGGIMTRGFLPPATPRLGPWETPTAPSPPPYMGRGISPDIGNRLLEAPTQTQQPGFSVIDAHPVTDPATGGITYVPEHYTEGQIPASAAPPAGTHPAPPPPPATPGAPGREPGQPWRPAVRGKRADNPMGRRPTTGQQSADINQRILLQRRRLLDALRPHLGPGGLQLFTDSLQQGMTLQEWAEHLGVGQAEAQELSALEARAKRELRPARPRP